MTQVTPRPGPRPGGAPAATQWITGDLVSGDGLAGAVAGVAAVVHCASGPRRPRVDVEGTRQLLEAARAAGIPHLVDVSIIGLDRVPTATTRPSWRPSA